MTVTMAFNMSAWRLKAVITHTAYAAKRLIISLTIILVG